MAQITLGKLLLKAPDESGQGRLRQLAVSPELYDINPVKLRRSESPPAVRRNSKSRRLHRPPARKEFGKAQR